MHQLIRSKFLTPSIILLIFIIDIAVPPGTAISILYVVPLGISITLSNKKIITAAAVSTFLTIIDTALYCNPEMHPSVFTNRILSIVLIWIFCYIIIRYKDLRKQKDKENEQYES
jgi:predicted membrane protein